MVCLVDSCPKVGDGLSCQQLFQGGSWFVLSTVVPRWVMALSTAVPRWVMVCLVDSCPKVGDGLSCQQLFQGG